VQDGRADFHGLFLDLAWVAAESGSKLQRTPDAGARILAYRFREASGVLRLAGAFGPEQNWDHLQTVIHECVCEVTAVLSQSKRKQASRTPYAGARIMLTKILHVFIVAAW